MADNEKRSKKLETVRKLLDQALGERKIGNHEAADNFEAKADQLMVEYAIEEAELTFLQDSKVREKPEVRTWSLIIDDDDWDINQSFNTIFNSICSTLGIKLVGGSWSEYKVLGWRQDLDHLDMMYTQIMLHMVTHLNPQGDKNLSEVENVVMLKEAGLKWKDVYRRMRAAGFYPHGPEVVDKKHGVRFTKLYTDYCDQNNRDRTYASPAVYRRSFIGGYSQEIRDRLWKIREAREDAAKGKEMVIVGMSDLLMEAYFELRPEMRPHPEDCECDRCHYKNCHDLKCQRSFCKEMRKPVRGGGRAYNPPKMDASARNAGRRAASTANLGSTGVSGEKGALQ